MNEPPILKKIIFGVENIDGSLTNEIKKPPVFEKRGFWC